MMSGFCLGGDFLVDKSRQLLKTAKMIRRMACYFKIAKKNKTAQNRAVFLEVKSFCHAIDFTNHSFKIGKGIISPFHGRLSVVIRER